MIDTRLLGETAAAWGVPLSAAQLAQFQHYADELRRWNAHHNLTAIVDETEIVTRHFLDSLRLALSWGDDPRALIDIGSGAGFPGLPLAILRPRLAVTLAESVEKKAAFLRHMATELGLDRVAVVTARAEALGRDATHRERYDVVTARAVAELRVLLEYCLPLAALGGRVLAPKGAQIAEELERAATALDLLGGRLLAVEPVDVPGLERRSLVVVEKIAATTDRFPRAVGVPSKRPL